MRTFLINLDRNKERLSQADAQLKSLGIAYERFVAVDGRTLSKTELRRNVAWIRSRFVRLNKLTRGEVGCTLSHLSVFRKMVEENIPAALIFEDDILLSRQFTKALIVVEKTVAVIKPQVYLFTWSQAKPINTDDNSEFEVVKVQRALRADAYVITLPAAKAILELNYPIVAIIDWWCRWRERGGIELYRVIPPTSTQRQNDFVSEVTPEKPRPLSGIRWFVWKLIRIPSVAIDRLLWYLIKK